MWKCGKLAPSAILFIPLIPFILLIPRNFHILQPGTTLARASYLCNRMNARLIFSCWSLLFGAILIGQPAVKELNTTDAKGHKQGAWSRTWPNGTVRYTGQFKDDAPVGTFKHFDEEGKLTTMQEHAGDGKVSRARHFRPDGALMATGKYVGQAKDSTWNYYGEAGHLTKVERYRNGQLDGEQVTYFPNGAVAESELRKAGVLEGLNKSWFDNGQLKSQATYVNGLAEGQMTFYHPNGSKEIGGVVVQGVRNGTWLYFNSDGSLQLQALYKNGELVKERKENGTFKDHFDDEQLKSEETFKSGKREGKFTEYHHNGKWELKTVPADPIKGTPEDMERILVGQTKKREGTYKNDLLEGELKEYDEKGKLVKTTRFSGGVEVK